MFFYKKCTYLVKNWCNVNDVNYVFLNFILNILNKHRYYKNACLKCCSSSQ